MLTLGSQTEVPGWGASIYLLLGGIALFMLGLHFLADGLRRTLGGRLRWAFEIVSRNRFSAAATGFAITGPMQSSGSTTLLLMGLADAGMISSTQCPPIILGAMAGSTVIPQLLAFPIAQYGLLAVIAGIPFLLFGRRQAWKSTGWALAGFGLMFFGISVVTEGAQPIKDSQTAAHVLAHLTGHPLMAVISGLVLTAIIQSGGAAVVLVMSLAAAGAVAPEDCLPLLIGINVGSCTPAVLAAFGAGYGGRRVVAFYLGFKSLGALLALPVAGIAGPLMAETLADAGAGPARTVASLYMAYNLLLVAIFIFPADRLASLFGKIVPKREQPVERISRQLNRLLGQAPSLALQVAEKELIGTGRKTASLIREGLIAMAEGGSGRIESLKSLDDEIDASYAALSDYLSRVSAQGLTARETEQAQNILYSAKLLEEIGDLISRDLARLAAKRSDKAAMFTIGGEVSLKQVGAAAAADLERLCDAIAGEDLQTMRSLGASSQGIGEEFRHLISEHFDLLGKGLTAAKETHAIYPDALAVLRHVRCATAEIARVFSGDRGVDS